MSAVTLDAVVNYPQIATNLFSGFAFEQLSKHALCSFTLYVWHCSSNIKVHVVYHYIKPVVTFSFFLCGEVGLSVDKKRLLFLISTIIIFIICILCVCIHLIHTHTHTHTHTYTHSYATHKHACMQQTHSHIFYHALTLSTVVQVGVNGRGSGDIMFTVKLPFGFLTKNIACNTWKCKCTCMRYLHNGAYRCW